MTTGTDTTKEIVTTAMIVNLTHIQGTIKIGIIEGLMIKEKEQIIMGLKENITQEEVTTIVVALINMILKEVMKVTGEIMVPKDMDMMIDTMTAKVTMIEIANMTVMIGLVRTLTDTEIIIIPMMKLTGRQAFKLCQVHFSKQKFLNKFVFKQ